MHGDRLRLHALKGTIAQTIDPTSLDLDGVTVVATELYRRAGPSIEDDARALLGAAVQAPAVRSLHLDSGLAAAAVIPTKVMPSQAHHVGDGGILFDLIGRAIVAHPDGTLVAVSVSTWPGMADGDLHACTTLALRILGTIEAGGRRLDLRGGERRLSDFIDGRDLVLDVPDGLVQEGVSRVMVVAVGAAGGGSATLDVDTYDDWPHQWPNPSGVRSVAGGEAVRIGESLTWDGPCTLSSAPYRGLGRLYEQMAATRYPDPDPNRDRGLRVHVRATDPGSCEQMKAIARTMRLVAP
jgi:hypothetical protein